MNDSNQYFDPADVEANKVISALSYLGILFFLPLVACPGSAFGRFHANQGLLILLLSIAVNVVTFIVRFIPFIGGLVTFVCGLVMLALFLFGLINTLNGHAKELPIIGSIQIIK